MLVIPLSPSLDVWVTDGDSPDGPYRALAVAYLPPATLDDLDEFDAKILVAMKHGPVWYDAIDLCFDAFEAQRMVAIRGVRIETSA